jgi:hypothetical protein
MTAMELATFRFNKEEIVLKNYFRTGHKFIAAVAIKTTSDKGFEHVQQGDAIMTRARLAEGDCGHLQYCSYFKAATPSKSILFYREPTV